jgi:hypothetical protein
MMSNAFLTSIQMQRGKAFVRLEADRIYGTVDEVGASVEALLKYRREKAKKRVAGSYAYFGKRSIDATLAGSDAHPLVICRLNGIYRGLVFLLSRSF